MFIKGALALGLCFASVSGFGAADARDRNLPPQDVQWRGSELFTNGAISRIQIKITPADLDKLRKDSRQFVPATVSDAESSYFQVAIHLKGSVGSFRPLEDKPGLTLDFAKFEPNQRFHGLRRIHLNNSIEDPSYCNEQLGGELFRAAGIPAPRVSRAVVFLNGRGLGLYVLKEGFTEDFLACYFKKPGGNLFEPGEGHDVNQRLKRDSLQAPVQNRAKLKALGQATLEQDPERRWKRLGDSLELDSFIRFMALEVMLCHRDGYCLARNNFRLYQNLDSGKMIFFPHGMDQLFGSADLPWMPKMAGLVARAVIETPEGKQRYAHEFRSLFETLFKPETLCERVDQLLGSLSSVAEESEFATIKAEGDAVKKRIVARYRDLERQLKQAQAAPLAFTDGVAPLTDWMKVDPPANGQMDRVIGPGGSACLHILTLSDSSASWRTKVHLRAGRYRLEAKARVSGVKPLSFGSHQGAGLRVSGRTRQSSDLVDQTADWCRLSETFEVGSDENEVECICEFRAKGGQVWFDCASLKLVKEP